MMTPRGKEIFALVPTWLQEFEKEAHYGNHNKEMVEIKDSHNQCSDIPGESNIRHRGRELAGRRAPANDSICS